MFNRHAVSRFLRVGLAAVRPRSTGRPVAAAAAFALVTVGLVVPHAAQADTAPPPTTPATTATVSADPLPTVQIDGVVYAQAINGNTAYAAGAFTSARPAGAAAGTNVTPRANILSYNITTGVLNSSWNPGANGRVLAASVSPDGTRLYIAGAFTAVAGQARYRVAAFNTATGALVANWAPGVNSTVYDIKATNSTVYITGEFTNANNTARSKIAAFNASTGALLPFAPVLDGGYGGRALEISPDGAKVIVGGSFLTTNGSNLPGRGMAALDAVTGGLLPWAVNSVIRNAGTSSSIYSLSSDGDSVYGSGYDFGGTKTDDDFEGSFRARWSDGSLVWMEDCHGDTYSVFPMDGVVYKATHSHYCGNIGEFPQLDPWVLRHSLAFDKEPSSRTITPDIWGYRSFTGKPAGKLLHWYPTWTTGSATGVGQAGWDITANDKYLVYGGEFTAVNGVRQQGLVRFAKSTIAPNKVGPSVQGGAWALSVSSFRAGQARLAWQANYDPDNAELTYQVFKRGVTAPLFTTKQSSTYWVRPTSTFTDRDLTPGQTYEYRIRATDPFGNTTVTDWTPVTVTSNGAPNAYDSAVLADAARSYWPLNEPSGTAAFDWAGGNDVTTVGVTRGVAGPTVPTATLASGFAGSTSSSAATNNPEQAPNTFSVEAWFKSSSTTGGKIVGFGDKRTGASSSYDRHIYIDGAGRVTFGMYPGSVRVVQSATGFNNGQWHHVVGTLGSGGQALYLDGKPVGLRTDTTSGQAYQGYWRVGGDNINGWPNVGSQYLSGSIADVAVYANPLTAQQVQQHYDIAKGTVAPNAVPLASFTSPVTDLTVSVDASASSDPDGSITGYAWDFGDGSTGTGVTASHAYTTAGTYTVTLTVTDNRGAQTSTTRTVSVAAPNVPPSASFTAQATNLTVNVDASASSDPDGSITGYAWDFGDGKTGTGVTTSHTYAKAGTYTIKLAVSDDRDGVDNASRSVTVSAAPNAQPSAAFTAQVNDLSVALDASTSSDPDGTITGYAWSFGDGDTGTGVSTSHTYAAPGTYAITLTVTDDRSGTDSRTSQVTVNAPNPPLAKDDFERTLTGSWGSASPGGAWSLFYGNAAFSVADGMGQVSLKPSETREARLTSVSQQSAVASVKFSSDVASVGGTTSVTLIGRQVGSSLYSARVRLEPAGTVRLYLLRNEVSLGSQVLANTYSPGQVYNLKLSVTGSSPTALKAKAWPEGSPEPTAWGATATDATAAMQTAGFIGIRTAVSSVSTNALTRLRFDSWLVTGP